jgi:hypothetical protein
VINNITYKDRNNFLLNDNLGISFAKIKETIYHRLKCNYNDINVERTWRCQVGKHQYYSVSIVCDDNFKITIDSFIKSGLNMKVLYVSSQPNSLCVLTSD